MLAPPSTAHLLGTDDLGRDIFSRLIYGAPATVYASLLAVSVAIIIGLPVGLVAGFFGGWTDGLISRVIDTFLSFPAIVLAHDPFWFAHVPAGPHLTLAGHTHGGQVRLPWIGAFTNASRAPLRWSLGHVVEEGRQLYVTSGIGTSVMKIRRSRFIECIHPT